MIRTRFKQRISAAATYEQIKWYFPVGRYRLKSVHMKNNLRAWGPIRLGMRDEVGGIGARIFDERLVPVSRNSEVGAFQWQGDMPLGAELIGTWMNTTAGDELSMEIVVEEER